jgi:multidrug efflux pump subunit AcrA (membrane-fusion protein)
LKKLFILLVFTGILAGGYYGYKKYTAKPEIEILETARVEVGDIREVLVETGIIKPQVGAQVKIGARATGEIMEMRVKVGDHVEKGELIALIDDREIVKAIEQTKASIESARQTLVQVKETYPDRIREAKANYEYNKIRYEREKELIKYEYTTQDSVDLAKSQFEASEANLKLLQDEYDTQLKIAQANLEALEAQLKQQNIRLGYTRIYTPINGVVSEVTAQEGETVVTGLQVANLVTVLDPTLLEMWIYVDETDIGRVRIGQPLEYYVDTYPNKVFNGVINKIYPQPVVKDNITYYLAIVNISSEDAAFLKPEMTSYVRVVIDEKRDVLVVPNAAVKFEEGRQIAYKVIGPKKVEKVWLNTGIRGEEKTEILSGLSAGDEVATKLILPAPGKS